MLSSWDELSDALKLVSMVAFDVERTMSAYFHLGVLWDYLENDIDTFNIAPSFLSEAIESMTYKVVLGTEKLFDKKSKAGVRKILNLAIEQKNTNHRLYRFAKGKRDELQERFSDLLEKLNYVRDKYYAHLDREAFSEDLYGIDIYNPVPYAELGELLQFAWSTLKEYFEICDAELPPKRTMVNDLSKLFEDRSKNVN